MFGVTVADDCSVVAVLCRSSLPPASVDAMYPSVNVFDVVADVHSKRDGYPSMGWDSTPKPEFPGNVIPIDYIYILEWTQGSAGQTSTAPDSIVAVNHGIGSWEYGSQVIELNAAKTVYFIDLKTAVQDPNGGWHEASTAAILVYKRRIK